MLKPPNPTATDQPMLQFFRRAGGGQQRGPGDAFIPDCREEFEGDIGEI